MGTPRKKKTGGAAEEELRARLGQQAAVADLGRRALAGAETASLLSAAVALVAQHLGVELCEVLELVEDGRRLLLRTGVGWDEALFGRATVETDAGSQVGRALLGDEPVVVADLRKERRFKPPSLLVECGVVSCMCVRIEGGAAPFGVLCAHATEPREFTADDANFLKAVANVLASAIGRGRDENALRKWREVFEHANWGLVIGGADGRTLELMNPAYARMHGYTVEELTGQPIMQVLAPEYHDAIAGHIRAAHREGHHVWEAVHMRRDGSRFPVLLDVTAVNDEEGRPLYRIVSVQDITDRKRAEEGLRLSEERFAKAFRASPDVMVISRLNDGVILEVNDRWQEFFGYAREEVVGRPSLALNVADPEARRKWAEVVRARGSVRDYGMRLRTKAGEPRDVLLSVETLEISGELCGLSIIRDVTEQKRAEARIRQQAALLDVAQDAILVRDLEDQVLYWNKGAERLYGWTAREAVGKSADELLFRERPPQLGEAQREMLERGAWSGELHQLTKEGRDVIVESRWTLVRDERGEARAKLVVNTDVTEKRRLEAELLRASHLSLIGELAAGLAHEIKNPLAGIKGAVDILVRRRHPGDPEVEVLEDVRHAVERIDQTVLALLERARARAPQLARASLEEVAHRAVLLARHHAAKAAADGRHVVVEFEPAPEPVVLPLDASQVEDAVLNLILNGIEAVESEGRVTVRVRREAHKGEAVEAVIEVEDTGRGIEESDRERVFSPFYTTTKGGTGLGLPAVRRIARVHGGSVEIRSAPGLGSTFTLRLPLPRRA